VKILEGISSLLGAVVKPAFGFSRFHQRAGSSLSLAWPPLLKNSLRLSDKKT